MSNDNESDKLARAYARLRALKENMPKGHLVDGLYVQEYHDALKHLEELVFDVEEFRVHPQQSTTTTIFRSGYVVERSFLLSKLDAVLGYFELVTQKTPESIGFRPPSR